MSDKELEAIWLEFENVPVNEDDEIEHDFHVFQKGTDKYDIWAWFDYNHSKGINYLLNGDFE